MVYRFTPSVLLGIFLALVPILVGAREIHVPADYPTINEAIEVADAGDTVLVASGPYNEWVILKSDVWVEGEDGACLYGTAISGPVVRAIDVHNAGVKNFAIVGGYSNWGGAVYCENSYVYIIGNEIMGNYAAYGGGGGLLQEFQRCNRAK
jgi:nitrous oxidase accessory protein NosD